MDQLPEFVELIHGMYLTNPNEVAKAFENEVETLQDIIDALEHQPGSTAPFEATPCEDFDADELADYVECLLGAFSTDPGDLISAFEGHKEMLEKIVKQIESGDVAVAESSAGEGGSISLTDDSDVIQLLDILKHEKTSVLLKSQAATLLRSNLWIYADNPEKILAAQGVKTLRNAMDKHIDEDEMVVKCCQTLESLFSYKGVMKQSCSASRQIIIGPYIVAVGKTWEPASFLCGKTKEPIRDEFYIINYVPYLPTSLSDSEKEGLILHHCKLVEPTEEENAGAAIPFITQMVDDNGLDFFVGILARNYAITKDEYVPSAGAKALKTIVDVDANYFYQILDILKASSSADVTAVVCCCFGYHATVTDDLLSPEKSFLMDKLTTSKNDHPDHELLVRKASTLIKRLEKL